MAKARRRSAANDGLPGCMGNLGCLVVFAGVIGLPIVFFYLLYLIDRESASEILGAGLFVWILLLACAVWAAFMSLTGLFFVFEWARSGVLWLWCTLIVLLGPLGVVLYGLFDLPLTAAGQEKLEHRGKPKESEARALVGLIAMGLVIVLNVGPFVGLNVHDAIAKANYRAAFAGHIASYLVHSGSLTAADPTLVGKVVIVNEQTRDIDDLSFYPVLDAIRADTPGEVGTIALVICTSEQTGTYQGGGAAYTLTCQIAFVDATQHMSTGSHTWVEAPPSSVNGAANGSGHKPEVEMAKYIAGLPRA